MSGMKGWPKESVEQWLEGEGVPVTPPRETLHEVDFEAADRWAEFPNEFSTQTANLARAYLALRAENARLAKLAAIVEALRPLCSVGESEDGEYWCLWLTSKHEKPDGDYGPAAIYFRSMIDDAEEQKREDGDPNWGPDVDAMLAEYAAAYAQATGRTDARQGGSRDGE